MAGRRWPVGRVLLWVLLVAPLAFQLYRYAAESVYYGEILHWTGLHATNLLLLTLVISPLLRILPRQKIFAWLRRYRRDLGLLTFIYAVAHAAVYVVRIADGARILDEAMEPGMLTGWVAFAVLLVLALTSNDRSVRALGPSWGRLHKAVYAAAILTMAHWVLTAFDPTVGYTYLGTLVVVLLLRLVPRRRAV